MPFNLEKKFKYKTRFISKANVVSLVNANLSKASIESLGSTLDIDSSEIEKNPDLLFVSADLFVSDVANKNGDLVDREGAIDLSKQVNKKYLNIEHEEELVVGALISPFFRKHDDNREVIAEEDLEQYDGSVVVGSTGYVWRSVNAKLANFMIEASEKGNKNYGKASMSWEVYFNDFDILKGSDSISKGKVISDKEEINKMKPFLKGYGGSGVYENAPIHRLIKGEKLFLGAGIVRNPAANVKGILTSESENFKNKKKSQHIKINVKGNKAMKISDITDYKQALASVTNGDEVDVKTLASLEANFDSVVEKAQASAIAEEIRKKSEEYTASLTEKEEAFAQAEEARAELDKKVVALESAKADLEGQLSELNEKVEAQEKQRVFDERMTALSSEFNLEGEVAKIVAEEIKDIDDEAYSAWLNKFKILAGSQVKAQASVDSEEGQEETAESEEVSEEVEAEVEEVISEASEEAKEEVPSSQHEYKSLEEEFESFEFELEGK